jgi:RimJ/RimL family protein N-acetyltransferase
MQIELAQCVLRPWRPSDVAALVWHANNRNIWRNVRDRFPHPYTREAGEFWVQIANENPYEPNFAIAVDDEAVGGIGLIFGQDIDRRSAEIGYWLSEQYWGRGIATAAVRALTEYAFAHFDLARIWANVFAWNPGSMRVLEKAGFVREGILRKAATKDGQTIDVVMYALVRD